MIGLFLRRAARARWVRRGALMAAAVVIGVSAIASPSAAMRHLRLLKSFPAKDAVLTTSPDAVRLWLSEPTQAPISKITVANATGEAVALDALTRADDKDAPLVAKLTKPIGAGQYTVTWKAMSKDGHVVNGTFGFRVNPAP